MILTATIAAAFLVVVSTANVGWLLERPLDDYSVVITAISTVSAGAIGYYYNPKRRR